MPGRAALLGAAVIAAIAGGCASSSQTASPPTSPPLAAPSTTSPAVTSACTTTPGLAAGEAASSVVTQYFMLLTSSPARAASCLAPGVSGASQDLAGVSNFDVTSATTAGPVSAAVGVRFSASYTNGGGGVVSYTVTVARQADGAWLVTSVRPG